METAVGEGRSPPTEFILTLCRRENVLDYVGRFLAHPFPIPNAGDKKKHTDNKSTSRSIFFEGLPGISF